MDQLVRAFAVFAQQVNNPGPLRATTLTLNPTGEKIDSGQLSYSNDEDTFELTHLHGVVQQIGFDTFMRCKNDTGATIPKGSVVGFAGVNSEIKVVKYVADGSVRELYFIGVTAFDMLDEEIGAVTLYGKLEGLNTTGSAVSETWAVGDILYASPDTPGALTKVRPTAPDVVISVAAVLSVSATVGELMIRPTVPIGMDYGTFTNTTDHTLAAIDTAEPILLDTTEISNGVSLGTPASRIVVTEAGFYQVAVSIQITSTNSSAKNIYFWLDRNGTSITNTTRVITLASNGEFQPFSTVYDISLQANDYIRVMWAADSTAVKLEALAASAFAPSAPSVIVAVTQMQL
jgi:hypothetical protein